MTSDALGGTADEFTLLTGFLDWNRAVVERKAEGLTRAQAVQPMTPSGLSVLGVIQHLAWVERGWFRSRFAGEEVQLIAADGDRTSQFAIADDGTIESVLAFYRDEIARARVITDSATLEELSRARSPHYGIVSLRWILVHMIEETARHAGHLDLMREQIDGHTGD